MIPEDFKKYYKQKCKDTQKRKNVEFLLSLEECWELWKNHWYDNDSNTTGYRKWCLARYNDTGNYEVGNCRVISHSENSKERWQTNRNYKPGKGTEWIGNIRMDMNRRIIVDGKIYSSCGEAGKEFELHKTTVANRCKSPNFPEWQYIDPPVLNGENF